MISHRQLLSERPAVGRSVRMTGRVEADRKGKCQVDVLSDVLSAVHLPGAMYFDITARQPWVAATPPMASICGKVMPGFEHVIAFHIMMEGWCWAQLADESQPEVRLEAGDAVVFVRGDAHFMSTELGERAAPDFGI